jgi:hypothetical protein
MSGVKVNLMSNSFPSKTLVVITSKGHHKVAVVVVVVITHHAMEIVCPMPSIGYPGTRVFDDFFQYSTTRVFGSSTRVLVS